MPKRHPGTACQKRRPDMLRAQPQELPDFGRSGGLRRRPPRRIAAERFKEFEPPPNCLYSLRGPDFARFGATIGRKGADR